MAHDATPPSALPPRPSSPADAPSSPAPPTSRPTPPPRFPVARGAQAAGERLLQALLRRGPLRSRYVTTSYGRVHCYDSAPDSHTSPALLVHGLGGSSLSLLPVAARLVSRRRVLLVDMLHFSDLSEPLYDALTSSQHVRALLEVIAKCSPGPVDYVGHSVGGGAGIHLATRHGEYLRSLSLINPGGFRTGLDRVMDDVFGIDAVRAAEVLERCVAVRPGLGGALTRRIGRRVLHELLSGRAVRDYLRTIHDQDCVDGVLTKVKCPTLLLWGEEDGLLPKDIALALTNHVADVEAYWVAGCSHLLPLEAPATVASTLARFWALPEERPGLLARLLPPRAPRLTPIPRPRAAAPG